MAHQPRQPPKVPTPFKECGYAPFRNEDAADGLAILSGKRQVVYALTGLLVAERHAAFKDKYQKRTKGT